MAALASAVEWEWIWVVDLDIIIMVVALGALGAASVGQVEVVDLDITEVASEAQVEVVASGVLEVALEDPVAAVALAVLVVDTVEAPVDGKRLHLSKDELIHPLISPQNLATQNLATLPGSPQEGNAEASKSSLGFHRREPTTTS